MIAGSHPGQDFEEVLGRALVEAFPDRVARRVGGGDSTAESGRARMVGGQGLTPGATRVRDSELFVALEVQAGTGDARVHLASAIEEAWLPEDAVRTGLETEFDESTGRVLAWQRRRYLDLILAQTAQAPVDHAVVGEKLLAAALMDRQCLELFEQGSAACFVARARCLAQWRPELDLPPFDDTLRQQTLAAAVLGKSSLAEVRRSEILELLRGSWRHDQLELLDRLAPERLSLPSGHSVAVQYEFGRPPVLAARIQDLFGWDEAPKLAGGRVALLLHLLAPNGRPQQITDDLSGFWRGSYAEVRRQLAGRYPKHAWPLEPWSASAGRPRR
jgi:ATP-dependent helicase HrpB